MFSRILAPAVLLTLACVCPLAAQNPSQQGRTATGPNASNLPPMTGDVAGEFAKVASLSFRLFGNILAGEVLLASISALLAYGAPIPFYFLEVLVGLIQALIFSMLLVVYFTVSSLDHDHEEHEEHGQAEHSVPQEVHI